jgi:hypothetical protein
MGTYGFILRGIYLAIAGCMPTILLIILFTDEMARFLNVTAPFLLSFVDGTLMLLFALALGFLSSFFLHKHFIRKFSYSIVAALHIPVQLAIITALVLVVVPYRLGIMEMGNWQYYVLVGFALSVIISDSIYLANYHRKNPEHLMPIEKFLSRKPKNDDERKPTFLRSDGFLWTDFENGIAAERDETNVLIARLEDEDSILIVGDQASGKTAILRSLGHRLALSGFIVFYASSDSLNVGPAIKDIENWNMSNVVILIDDVHRNPIVCADFLEKVHSHNVKIILSSRPFNVGIFREGQGRQIVRLFDAKEEAKVSRTLVSEIVTHYCRSLGFSYKPNEKDLAAITSKCGTDLWLINYLLTSWDPRRTRIKDLAKTDIYQKIYDTRISTWMIIDKDSLKTLEVVCALYQYEIPCAESYLLENGLNNVAFKLSLNGYLIKKGRYYYLHHPSVARIYLETFQFYRLIKNVSDFSINILFSYLEKSEEEPSEIFYRLSASGFLEENKAILERMLESLNIKELSLQIERETSLDKICAFFRSIYSVDENFTTKILKMLDEDNLAKKLQKEPAIKVQRDLISTVSRSDKDFAKLLSEKRLKIVAIIPLFNEGGSVSRVLKGIFEYVDIAVVVDDGSSDDTSMQALKGGAEVVRHQTSKGLWSAMLTGLERSISENADVIVFDVYPWVRSDYLPALLIPILNEDADLILADNYRTYSINRKGARVLEDYLKGFISIQGKRVPPKIEMIIASSWFNEELKVKRVKIRGVSTTFPPILGSEVRAFWLGPPFLKKRSFRDLLWAPTYSSVYANEVFDRIIKSEEKALSFLSRMRSRKRKNPR